MLNAPPMQADCAEETLAELANDMDLFLVRADQETLAEFKRRLIGEMHDHIAEMKAVLAAAEAVNWDAEPDEPENLDEALPIIMQHLADRRKILAVKVLRDVTGGSLVTSKNIIDALAAMLVRQAN